MNLNICMVASYFYPMGYGGNAVYGLCRNLVKRGLEVHVITSKIYGEPDFQLLQGINVHRLPTYFLRLFNTVYPVSPRALSGILKVINNDIDLIHAHFGIFQTTFTSSLVKRIIRKPMVLTMHGQGVTARSSYGSKTLDFMWLINHNTVERFTVSSADKIIALTEAEKTKAHKLGAKPENVFVIPNGVDIERFKPAKPSNDYYTELSLRREHKVVVFVGRLHSSHGVVLLLEAITRVVKTHPESRFILVGDGPLRQYVSRFIKSRGLDKYVRILGYREDIPQLLNIAHLFVYPALSVGMPLSVLEAMACEKLVMAFDIDGNQEIITNGKTGLLIQKFNASALASSITSTLSDIELFSGIGHSARKYVTTHFSQDMVTEKVISVYNKLARKI